ncbi:hypothetical protein EIP86_003045 [Pleurotus ostreatoroseus]|nr:hypothetical protein EIP86_003045 [Pleurotus ostreatoroseus]
MARAPVKARQAKKASAPKSNQPAPRKAQHRNSGPGTVSPPANATATPVSTALANGHSTTAAPATNAALAAGQAYVAATPIEPETIASDIGTAAPGVPRVAPVEGAPGNDGPSDEVSELNRLRQQVATLEQRLHAAQPAAPQVTPAPVDLIPKPLGSAGGGKKGFHLQAEMGLDSDEGRVQYNMILATVRNVAHAARIDLSKKYMDLSAEDSAKIFASARHIHPYLEQFENDWATAEILKQFMSSTRSYGRKMGYFA